MKENFGRSGKKVRVCLWIPIILDERLESDSRNYGVTKTSVITNALLRYYSDLDGSQNK